MARFQARRIRSIRPDRWDNEVLGACSLQAQLLDIGLKSLADDAGRLRGSVTLIRGRLFLFRPEVTEQDVASWLAELEGAHRVQRYEVDGVPYIQLLEFLAEENIDHPSAGHLPPPPGFVAKSREDSRKLATPRAGEEGSGEERIGGGAAEKPREEPSATPDGQGGKVVELRPQPAAPAEPIVFPCRGNGPETWTLTPDIEAELAQQFPELDVRAVARRQLAYVEADVAHRHSARKMRTWLTSECQRAAERRETATSASARTPAADPSASWNAPDPAVTAEGIARVKNALYAPRSKSAGMRRRAAQPISIGQLFLQLSEEA